MFDAVAPIKIHELGNPCVQRVAEARRKKEGLPIPLCPLQKDKKSEQLVEMLDRTDAHVGDARFKPVSR